MKQGSQEWLLMRTGKVTASRIGDLMAKTKSGYSASRDNYMAEIIAERLTGDPYPSFQSAAMKHGTETEPIARAAYEVENNVFVTEVAMIEHPKIDMAGASPDGLVDDGLVEFKCPNTATHISTLRTKKIDTRYLYQMQWQMACTGRKWCDFVSFDNRMPEHLQMFIKRVKRDDKLIKEIEEEVIKFIGEVEKTIKELTA